MNIEVLPLSVRGLRPESRKVDRDLWLWFCKAKTDSENYHGPRVTKRLVQAKAKEAFEAAGISNFKASDGWYFRWLKRWHRMDVTNVDKQSSSNAQVAKKQASRKLKAKAENGLLQETSRKEATGSNILDAGSSTCSPQTSSVHDCLSDSTISNLYLQVPKPVSSDTLQAFDENFAGQDAFSLSLADNSVLHTETLCDDTRNDFTDTLLLPKDCVTQYQVQNLERPQTNERFIPDTPFLVNLDDFSWHDISDLPSFGKAAPTKLFQGHDSHTELSACPTKAVLQSPMSVVGLTVQKDLKLPAKEKGKLYSPQKQLEMVVRSSAPCTASDSASYLLNKRPLVKGQSDPMCVNQISSEMKNCDVGISQPVGKITNFRLGKKLAVSAKTGNPCKFIPTKHVFNVSGHATNSSSQEEPREINFTQLSSKSPHASTKNTSKFYSEHGKAPIIPSKGNNVRFARSCGKGKKGSHLKEPSHSSDDFEEASCDNFSHHDLEDVSVSSDFVNQLNDENSLELNLEYGHDSLSHRISPSRSKNMRSDSEVEQPVLNGFINLMSSPSEDVISSKSCESPESGCHMSVVEDDLSSEENDYISEAVLLSMQEDDFSILNCDQSPFQGTISVIDENSQPECEKIQDLDEGMHASFAMEENGFEDGEILFPPQRESDYNILCQESEYSNGEMIIRNNTLENSNSAQTTLSTGKGEIHFPSSQESTCKQQKDFVYSHTTGGGTFSEQQNVLCLSPLSDDRHEDASIPDLLHSSASMDGNGISSNVQHPPVQRCLTNAEEQGSISNNMIVEGGNLFQISSTTGEIALIGGQDLLHISSASDANTLVTEQDVFLTCFSEVEKTSSLSSENYLVQNDSLLVSNSCTLRDTLEEAPSMFFVPCTSKDTTDSDNATHCSGPNYIASNNLSPNVGLSHNPGVMSQSDVTVAHADSTTVLLTPSIHSYGDSGAKLLTLTTPSAFILKTAPLASSMYKSAERPENCQDLSTSLVPDISVSLPTCNTVCQFDTSSNPIICESSKENGFTSYDLQLVESVLSEQDDAPGNASKYPKKNSAYLTEKGNNLGTNNGPIEDHQTSYRRSSGDRYFPYFKERVANYALKHTAKEAARYFGVNVDTVTMWTRARQETDSVVRNYPDQHMLRWLKRNRENGIILTQEQIAQKAKELLKTPGCWIKDKTRWFHIWASRLDTEEEKKKSFNTSNKDCKTPLDRGEKKALYPEEFKVEVALYAEQTSKNLASSIFKIARKRVYEWSVALKVTKITEKEKSGVKDNSQGLLGTVGGASSLSPEINGDPKNFKISGKGIGRAVTSVTVDHQLWLWFCEQTAKKSKPKSTEIRAKAVELFRAHNHDKIKCSHGWLKKWSLRYGIALRHEGDSDLVAWCLEQFDHNRNISHRDLLNYAHESLTGTHKSEFKASAGWLLRFCKRHKNLLSTKPSIDIEIPTVLKQKVSEFRIHVQKSVHSSGVPLDSVGCLDEVPLNFTAGGSRSRLLLRRSGLENCHAIVVLSCLASGELLPPALIFKGEGPSEEITHEDVSVLIFYQKDCCMSDSIMLQWIDSVWTRKVATPSVLVTDCYEPHCSQLVQDKCCTADVSLCVIPAGCSYKLQPLDLAISQLFEANIYNRWTRHFSAADQLSACKRTSYSSNSDIIRWVAEAYKSFRQTRKEAIRRSFLVTGLTSAVNGSEDHLQEDSSHMPFSSLFNSHP